MKIVIIGPAHPLRGGLASYNERLARQFQREGHDVTIYTFSLQYPGFLFPGTTQFSSEPKPNDLVIQIKINSVNPFNWLAVGNELRKQRPDIVVVRYWLPFMGPALGTILRRIKKNNYTKVICIADNVVPHEKRLGDIAFTRYFVKPVDGFITMSDKVMNDLKQFTERSARLVAHPLYDNFGAPLPKEEARKKLGINPSEKIILFFGFIRKYKGLDLLLQAVKILKDKYPHGFDFKVLIAGEFYEDSKPYEEQIKTLNISDQLLLHTQFIPDSEIKYYLCSADVVVQPYRNATQSGVTPLAYHFEKPMIVTNVGALPDLVPHNVGIVTEPNPEAIAESMKHFFSLEEHFFIQGIKQEKEKYKWSNITDAIYELASPATERRIIE
jgi:glycosyltransferase involved in cell wall biosynthesis